ncbi:ESX secretion-associated protein EspG [Amycolatopsis sp. FDAARGOS 1241]|uniref:ESX secretion-associated protein EspG n=1 Tax=Amycolatopsis sp. FDAARGOS 1241 TaxID=2778070 RepID=UPI001951C82D|nr:ESX secretion-associated protein EspG [Amycolatopsis sp. FDAARGOS 1241]QRP46578.1 ESX secretion-associated protein EspG [Amycolatopsis sp. FDAARGOS 1241]
MFNGGVSSSAAVVFDVIDEVIAPLRAEVPERPSVMEFYDPQFSVPPVLVESTGDEPDAEPLSLADEVQQSFGPSLGPGLVEEVEQYARFVAGMSALGLAPEGEVTPEAVGLYRVLRGGFIRGVVTGVFPTREEPWEVRFFGDDDYTTVMSKRGRRARLRSGLLSALPGWVFDGLPDRPPGPGPAVRIETDHSGLVPPVAWGSLDVIRSAVARPRLGTVLVDLAVRDAVLAEYPHGAFGLVDNDQGRYQFRAAPRPDGGWVMTWTPATRGTAEAWIVEAVKRHA